MLWLCLHFPRLPATALGLENAAHGCASAAGAGCAGAAPEVVTDQRSAQRWLITDAPGLRAGTPWASAIAQQPGLRGHARKPSAERAALRQLAWAAYRFGSPVCSEIADLNEAGRVPGFFLWIEIGASRKLFGGIDGLRAALCAELVAMGQPACMAIAPTRAGAALLARAGETTPQLTLPEMRKALSARSIRTLPWPGLRLQALWSVGLRRIGALLELPRDALARRFGSETLDALDRLLGSAPDPFQALVPPPVFRRRFELPGEVEGSEGLLFPLRRLCLELQAYLRARDVSARGFRLICTHARVPGSRVELRFTQPHRDGVRMFEMLRERLSRQALPAPVRELHLHADDFSQGAVMQADLFEANAARLAWPPTLERLAGRLGSEAVWTPAPLDDHRPERAHRRAVPGKEDQKPPPALSRLDGQAAEPASSAMRASLTRGARRRDRPAWLLREPQPVAAPPGSYPPHAERIESGWWDGADAVRDYYTVEREGARTWMYCDRTQGRWYVQGWWG